MTAGSGDRAVHGTGPDPLVVVAVVTWRRPDMLDALLASCEVAVRGVRVVFVVVDNDAEESARRIVDARRDRFDAIHYVCEPRRGIPIARNRALDEAHMRAADVLCFIDDDERPSREWLTRLVGCWRSSGADLIGGPVEIGHPPAGATSWQRLIGRSLAARMRRKNRMTAAAADRDRDLTIVTNNWLCDLAWQRRTGVRFDESLRYSGGSDTAFCRAARAAGCTMAWCREAIVRETVPPERLSLGYQFRRAAAQSTIHAMQKSPSVTPGSAAGALIAAAARSVLGVLLLVFPVLGLASPVTAVRSLGWSVGRVRALLGLRSELYR